MIFVKMSDKLNFCCQIRKIKANPILPQQQWWGDNLMLLTACSDTKKQEHIIQIVANKLDELACIGLSNTWAIIQIPLHNLWHGIRCENVGD